MQKIFSEHGAQHIKMKSNFEYLPCTQPLRNFHRSSTVNCQQSCYWCKRIQIRHTSKISDKRKLRMNILPWIQQLLWSLKLRFKIRSLVNVNVIFLFWQGPLWCSFTTDNCKNITRHIKINRSRAFERLQGAICRPERHLLIYELHAMKKLG